MAKKPRKRNWGEPSEIHEVWVPHRRPVRQLGYTEVGGRHFTIEPDGDEYRVIFGEYVWRLCKAADGELEIIDRPDFLEKTPPKDSALKRAVKKYVEQLE